VRKAISVTLAKGIYRKFLLRQFTRPLKVAIGDVKLHDKGIKSKEDIENLIDELIKEAEAHSTESEASSSPSNASFKVAFTPSCSRDLSDYTLSLLYCPRRRLLLQPLRPSTAVSAA